MPEPVRPPVAIRVTRPCRSEDEFLEKELETISTRILLVDAQPRPEGVVLRFEVLLADGRPLVRGEGRVVGLKQQVLGAYQALALRFTRLDPQSKALVDRATLLRDARRAALGIPTSAPSTGAFRAVSSLPPPPEEAMKVAPFEGNHGVPGLGGSHQSQRSMLAVTPNSNELVGGEASRERGVGDEVPTRTAMVAPPSPDIRNAMLERLRKRAKDMSPEAVTAILAQRRRG